MNIYADATRELKEREFTAFSEYMDEQSKEQEKEQGKESTTIKVIYG